MSAESERYPVVILCGGRGTRFREQTETKPKPMIEVCGRPILWHIMSFYAGHGFRDFVLCLGYKASVIKRYFLDYASIHSDFTVDLSEGGQLEFHGVPTVDWRVTCVDTGLEAMTGARLKRVQKYIDSDTFFLTYGDGLSDVRVPDTLAFHREHGKLATVTGVRPQNRFGELVVEGREVKRFSEKPAVEHSYINGGFFVFDRRVFDYVTNDDSCILERAPLEQLAEDSQLVMYPHLLRLETDWNDGDPPWKSW